MQNNDNEKIMAHEFFNQDACDLEEDSLKSSRTFNCGFIFSWGKILR